MVCAMVLAGDQQPCLLQRHHRCRELAALHVAAWPCCGAGRCRRAGQRVRMEVWSEWRLHASTRRLRPCHASLRAGRSSRRHSVEVPLRVHHSAARASQPPVHHSAAMHSAPLSGHGRSSHVGAAAPPGVDLLAEAHQCGPSGDEDVPPHRRAHKVCSQQGEGGHGQRRLAH